MMMRHEEIPTARFACDALSHLVRLYSEVVAVINGDVQGRARSPDAR